MFNKTLHKSLSFVLVLSMMLTVLPVFSAEIGESAELVSATSEKGAEIPATNGIIVKMKEGASATALAQSLSVSLPQLKNTIQQKNTLLRNSVPENSNELTLLPIDEEDIPTVLEALNENENVIFAQPNYRVALSEIDMNQWGLQNVGQSANTAQGTAGYDINVLEAWNITQGSEDVVVGVIDSGIDINHEALADKIWHNSNETQNDMDDDGNGYIDDLNGWDFVNGDNSVYDSAVLDGHGTHIAGIISSVAPNVKIMPLKAFGYNAGYTFDIINAIQYAEAMGVKIVNCSFAGTEYNTALADAIEQSNMLFVCAAGNYARSTDELSPFPACYGFPNIISVAAIDSTGTLSPISTYGDKIDIAAPGINIYSTLPESNYGFKDGTSMAAAYASGAAALVLSNNGELSAKQIRQIIKESATTPVIMPSLSDNPENLLDVLGALEQATPEPEREIQIAPIPGEDTIVKVGSLYPFRFELVNDELSLILDNNEIYQTVSVSVWEKTGGRNAAVLLNEEANSTQTVFVIEDFIVDTEYEFNIKFNNEGLIENYIGDFKVYFSGERSANVVNFRVVFNDSYTTEEYQGGEFELMANRTESESNNSPSLSNYIADDDNMTGKINPSGDVDWFYISFPSTGVANFYLDVPTDKDYDIELYDSNGTTRLAYPAKGTGVDELIRYYPVTANKRYYIKVVGWDFSGWSATATYLLRAKWYITPDDYEYDSNEGNDTFGSATALSSANTQISANINHGNDTDYYKFTISSTQYVNIALFDMPRDYDMKIYNSSQTLLTTCQKGTDDNDNPYNEVYSASLAAGTYYIQVYPYGGSYSGQDYKLAVSTGRDTLSLNTSSPLYHSLTSGNRFYSFNLTQARLMYIEMLESGSGNDFDVYVYKKDSGNTYTEVARAFTGNHPEKLSLNLTSGDYLVWINRYSGSGSYYDLFTESTTSVTALSSQITLGGFPTDMMAGEQKTVTVSVKNLGSTVWTNTNNFTLYDHTANLDSLKFTSLPLQLSSSDKIGYGQTKTFTFTLTAPNPSPSPKTYTLGFVMRSNGSPFGAGQTKNISVTGFSDLTIPTNTTISGVTERLYRLQNLPAGNYVFRTLYTSADCDTTLTLYNSSMTQIDYNDDKYGSNTFSLFSRIEKTLSAGTYYLKVNGLSNSAVTCRIMANLYTDTTLTATTPQTVNNQLEGFYKFVPSSTGTYVISTSKYGSTNHDTFMFLLNSSGTRIAYDDDGGDGNYSRISYSLTSGTTYYIRVSSYDYGKLGKNTNVSCTLTVGLQTDSPPPENQAAIAITAPTNGTLLKVYNDNSVKITGTCANVGSVSVSVNNSNLSNVKKTGNTFEVSFKPTVSGSYTIKATGTATYGTTNPSHQIIVPIAVNDDGDTQATATKLNIGMERTAAIDFAGDVDWFSFTPSVNGIYEVSVLSPIALQKTTYEQSGTYAPLTFDNSDMIELLAGKTYYFKIQSQASSSTGKYTIKISNSSMNYTFNSARPIGINQAVSESIKNLQNKERYYQLDLTDGYETTITLSGIPSGCNYELELYQQVGTKNFLIAESKKTGNTTEIIVKPINKGKYFIKVYSASGYSTNTYTLTTVSPAMTYSSTNLMPMSGAEIAYDDTKWNFHSPLNIQGTTNCYAYALNLQKNPLSGSMFPIPNPGFCLQPGDLAQYANPNYTWTGDIINDSTGKTIISVCEADAAAIGGVFTSVTRNQTCPPGTYKVALILTDPNNPYNYDYHWLRQNTDGTWSQKHGSSLVVNLDDATPGQLVYDPLVGDRISKRPQYYVFVGYFAVKSIPAGAPEAMAGLSGILSSRSAGLATDAINPPLSRATIALLEKGMSVEDAHGLLGLPHDHLGSGIIKDVYDLENGGKLVVCYGMYRDALEYAYIIPAKGEAYMLIDWTM